MMLFWTKLDWQERLIPSAHYRLSLYSLLSSAFWIKMVIWQRSTLRCTTLHCTDLLELLGSAWANVVILYSHVRALERTLCTVHQQRHPQQRCGLDGHWHSHRLFKFQKTGSRNRLTCAGMTIPFITSVPQPDLSGVRTLQ
jgi:hypothetical protein